jgi:hypothetical protein
MGKSNTRAVSLPTHKQILQMLTVSIENGNHLARFVQLAGKFKVKGITAGMRTTLVSNARDSTRIHKWLAENETLYNQVIEATKAVPAAKPAAGKRTRAAGG